MLKRSKQSGDTLVEVLLAFMILAIITVGAYSVLNSGIGSAQQSLERSQVRTSIDGQVELVTYFRDQYMTALSQSIDPTTVPAANEWYKIRNNYALPNVGKTPTGINQCSSTLAHSFSVQYAGGVYSVQPSPSPTAALLPTPGQGLWIEPIASSGLAPGAPSYVDLYVRACWDPIVGTQKQALSSVVRLYDK